MSPSLFVSWKVRQLAELLRRDIEDATAYLDAKELGRDEERITSLGHLAENSKSSYENALREAVEYLAQHNPQHYWISQGRKVVSHLLPDGFVWPEDQL